MQTDLPLGPDPLHLLFQARVHLGHRTGKWHPKMASYIYGVRGGLHLLDLKESARHLTRALRLVAQVLKKKGHLLIVGNRAENSQFAGRLGLRYHPHLSFVHTQWMGGSLTNRQFLTKAMSRAETEEAGTTLRQRRIRTYLSGWHPTRRPNLILLLNAHINPFVLEEARRLNLPLIGVVDTNNDPGMVSYPIPGNDDTSESHFLYCQAFSYVIQKALVSDRSGPSLLPSEILHV